MERTLLPRPPSRLQGDVGPTTETSTEGIFYLRNHSGRRPDDSNQSIARSTVCTALVSALRPLSRDVAFCGAGRNRIARAPARAHRGIQPPGARFFQLPAGSPLGRRESRTFPALNVASAFFGHCRSGGRLRRQGGRRYVLFDQVPKGCREEKGDQLRAPVFQDQSLHNCCAVKFPRSVAETFPE